MQQRQLGRTGISVSVLGYGCGAIGGLMVKGSAAEQDRAIGRAIDQGITYFDTAYAYGEGVSETNLGRALKALRATVTVGTKVRVYPQQRGDIAGTVAASIEGSLVRLGSDCVDIYQLHNPITLDGAAPSFTVEQMLNEAVPVLRRLREQGKCRFYGITGLGDAPAVRRVLEEGGFATAQMPYNLLNPSGIAPLPAGSAMTDLEGRIAHAASRDVGVMAIRILAGGALSGSEARSPLGVPKVEPIASGADYAADVAAARRLMPVIEVGHAKDLVDLALRFATMPAQIATAIIGTSSIAELDHAVAAVERGPLPDEALAMIAALRAP
ncbi:aldo/keto reductase [Neoroseomonas lacus]|uniref:D-threo-aldose 1-dehydrogenase n=1 Tax=Neoroseomonas lacus TaxID=287609 RepID=A0A917KDF3_9PROT|nr:aldo/keto reductase [Neoroseomonas lacus]GGJ07684.1 D-threo-aldose 1-dehydrogenase [Neoroseomonas lacus]